MNELSQYPDVLDGTLNSDQLTRTYIIPAGTPINEYMEICLDAYDDNWVARLELDQGGPNHRVVVYNATEAIIGGVKVEVRQTPDFIGPVTDPDEPAPEPAPDPIPPPKLTQGVVTAAGLNVRATPFVTTTNKVGGLNFQDVVWLLEDQQWNDWWKILWDKPGDPWAFVSKKYIKVVTV